MDVFQKTSSLHGLPASLLTDNGAVFTGFYRNGKVLLETELERLGVTFKNSRPYHPQTCGKIERLHQTLKRYLTRQTPPGTLPELQVQLDTFAHYYNDIRPHRALHGATPLQAYSARIKARPATPQTSAGTHFRVRHDRVDQTGKVTLRYHSRLYKIGFGRAHKGRQIKLLIADRHIRVIDRQNGELLRELTLDPTHNYQPLHSSQDVYDLPRHPSRMSRDTTREGWLDSNPLASVKRASKRHERERILRRDDFYDPEEVDRLLKHAPSVFEEAFWLCGAHAGLRLPGEALGLRWGAVDFQTGVMRPYDNWVRNEMDTTKT